MNAAQLAELNGVLARAAAARAAAGDPRDKGAIIDDVLLRAAAPDLRTVNERIAGMTHPGKRNTLPDRTTIG